MYQVLIVDNHPTVGAGTKFILEQSKQFHVTYVKTGALALELLTNIKFHIILSDLYMSDMDGIALVKQILAYEPQMKILIFTGFAYEHAFNELIELGISGFISKKMSIEQLSVNILAALKGDTIIPTQFFKRLRKIEADGVKENYDGLTTRERHIMGCVLNGLSNREIAEQIYLSQRAVEYQLNKLYMKYEVKTRKQFIKYIIERKLLDTEYNT